MKRNRDEIARQIRAYSDSRDRYVRYAEILGSILGKIAYGITSEAIVQTRAKAVSSYAEKIQRPGKSEQYGPDPMKDLTDLCGGRVILPTLTDVAACSNQIEENLRVHWEDSEDKLSLLSVQEFGYLSNHYVVSISPASSYTEDIDVPDEVLGLKAEIQVRTFLQHAWSVIQHDYLYKPNFSFPIKVRRQFHRIAAILEDADFEFGSALDNLKTYEANYGAYMSPEQINEQIDRLALVYSNAPDQSQEIELVLRIAKLARYVARWDVSIRMLRNFSEDANPAALRELGIALYKSNAADPGGEQYKQGQSYLMKAIELNPDDVDALTALAGSWKKQNLDRSFEYLNRAYSCEPEDPYTFQNYRADA